MAWRRADSKPLPGSVVIQVNDAYMLSRIDWVDYFTVLGKYIDAEKNGTVWAHEGYLHPHSWKWAIPIRQVGSGRGTGWPWFVKSPMARCDNSLSSHSSAHRGYNSRHGILQSTEYWRKALDGGQNVDTVARLSINLPHGFLIAKLHAYNGSSAACKFIISHLTNRVYKLNSRL